MDSSAQQQVRTMLCTISVSAREVGQVLAGEVSVENTSSPLRRMASISGTGRKELLSRTTCPA